jgi:hypothetical protein
MLGIQRLDVQGRRLAPERVDWLAPEEFAEGAADGAELGPRGDAEAAGDAPTPARPGRHRVTARLRQKMWQSCD